MTTHIPLPNLVIELSTFAYAALCFRQASRGPHSAIRKTNLVFAMLFAYAVEWYFVNGQNEFPYHYGEFLLKVGGVPLWVSAGWGLIVYTAMDVTQTANVPWWSRPIANGLLAVNIDLALDPIAQALQLWTWGPSPSGAMYFGVPFENFIGWMLIVGSFSFCKQLVNHLVMQRLQWMREGWRQVVVDLLACVLGAVVAFVMVTVATVIVHDIYTWKVFGVELGEAVVYTAITNGGLLLVMLTIRRTRNDNSPNWVAIGVPVYFHSFVLLAYFIWVGAQQKQDGLSSLSVVVPILMMIGCCCYAWPSLQRLFPGREPEQAPARAMEENP